MKNKSVIKCENDKNGIFFINKYDIMLSLDYA